MNELEEIFKHLNPDNILLRISSKGKITEQELRDIIYILETLNIENLNFLLDDLYTLLVILGKNKDEKHLYIFNKYLTLKDPFIVALIIETLCLKWEKIEEYLENVINFALGVPWDIDEDIRLIAIKILGEYLSTERKAEQRLQITQLLLKIFDDTKQTHFARQSAYVALCRATGKPDNELPNDSMILNLNLGSKDIDWEVINQFL